jgi:hypothetical protein
VKKKVLHKKRNKKRQENTYGILNFSMIKKILHKEKECETSSKHFGDFALVL